MSYVDSAYIATFYLDEPDSEGVRRLAESLGQVHCIVLGQLEVVAVFHRKLREGAFDEAAFREVMAQFGDDCAQGLWTWLPISLALVARAATTFGRLPKSVFLRAIDALHLTCAREHSLREIYTNDRHMSSAARHFKLRAVTVEQGQSTPGSAPRFDHSRRKPSRPRRPRSNVTVSAAPAARFRVR